MSRAGGRALGALAAAAAWAVTGCGLPDPPATVRVSGAAPEGDAVPVDLEAAEVRFSGPIDPGGVEDGARLVLVPEDLLRDALEAVESEEGAAGLAGALRGPVTLVDGGRRVVLRPAAPLRPRTAHALVLSSRLRAAGGGPVLDPDGRRRPFVARFTTGAPPGPPPRPVIAEVRADADTPEAGGEWVEIANLGEGALDLTGLRLAKRTSSGSLSSCLVSPEPGAAVPAGGRALVVGGAYDDRYRLREAVLVARCGAAALLGGIANDRPPELLLLEPSGAVLSTLGAGGIAPSCEGTVERIDEEGPDEAWNLACGTVEGSPGEP